MKLRYIISGAALLSLCLSACSDQMDHKEIKINDDALIKRDFESVGKITSKIYQNLDYDFGQMYGGASLCSATDEAVYSHEGNAIERYYDGSWNATSTNSYTWSKAWEAIGYCNLFLADYTDLTFPEHKLEKDYPDQMIKYENYQWEVRFLRAYNYFLLVRQYGDVPLITENLNAEEANNKPRVSADEIFEFIDSECDVIKDEIIQNYSGAYVSLENEPGRVNNLGVLALRARAALYHASPLFSEGKTEVEKKALWKHAAECGKACIDECKKRNMTLAKDYSVLFSNTNWNDADANKEIIFAARAGDSNSFERYNFPTSILNAGGGNCPTENLVSAYEMKNGLPISDPTSGYDQKDPYKDRDGRLKATVAVCGEKWPTQLEHEGLELWLGGSDSRSAQYGTPTGYYLKKYVCGDNKISGTGQTNSKHTWILFRLGQVYLDYAEALFNYCGNGYDTPDGFSLSAAAAINTVRKRAGQPDLPVGLSRTEFEKRYENERFVELAFEGHRMYDVRRWKKAPQYFVDIKVMEITKNGDELSFTTVTNPTYITKRAWAGDHQYLWPIPQSEVLKSGNLIQNPGW